MHDFHAGFAFLGVRSARSPPPGCWSVAPSAGAATAAEAAAANATMSLLNRERAANHLPALRMSAALISSAHRHNLSMAAANTLSHQLPGEPVFSTRISQAGVAWHSAAENIGYTTNRTTAGSQSLETAMYNEVAPNNGHRLNILSTSVHYVGIDVYIDARTGKLWLTEDFADVGGPTARPPPRSPHPPRTTRSGHLDRPSALAGHKLQLVGWAYDPDATARRRCTSGVYFDGKIVGALPPTPIRRPDVASALARRPEPGLDREPVRLPAGRHTIRDLRHERRAGRRTCSWPTSSTPSDGPAATRRPSRTGQPLGPQLAQPSSSRAAVMTVS